MTYPYGKKGGLIRGVTQDGSPRAVFKQFRCSLESMIFLMFASCMLMLTAQYFIQVWFHIFLWSGVAVFLYMINKRIFNKVIVCKDRVELHQGFLGLKRVLIPIKEITGTSFDDLRGLDAEVRNALGGYAPLLEIVYFTLGKNKEPIANLRLAVTETGSNTVKIFRLDGISNPSAIYDSIKKLQALTAEPSISNNDNVDIFKQEKSDSQSGRETSPKIDLSDGVDIFTLKPSASRCFLEAAKISIPLVVFVLLLLGLASALSVVSGIIAIVFVYFFVFAFLKELYRIAITSENSIIFVKHRDSQTLINVSNIIDILYEKSAPKSWVKSDTLKIKVNKDAARIIGTEELTIPSFFCDDPSFHEFRKRVLGDKAPEIKATPDVC